MKAEVETLSDGTLHVTVDLDISTISRILLSQNGTHWGELYYSDALQPEIIACGDCKHWICHDKRCGYWNHGVKPLEWCCHAERRTDDKRRSD